MPSTFWTNTIWYLLLGVIMLVLLVYSLVKSKRPAFTFAFFATLLGFTLFIETLILIFGKAYSYYPYILSNPHHPYDSNLAGNLFSQYLISATMLFAVVKKLKPYWYFIFALLFACIELLFLRLGIYEQYWYKTWMTVAGFPLLFFAAKWMYDRLLLGIKPFLYYVYIFDGLFWLTAVTVYWGMMVSGILEYSGTLFGNPIHSRMLLAMIVFIFLAIPLMILYFKRPKWPACVMVLVLLVATLYAGNEAHVIQIRYGWFIPVSSISILWMYGSIALLDHLYCRGPLHLIGKGEHHH